MTPEVQQELREMVSERRSRAAALPAYTMRDDPRVAALQELDVRMIKLAAAHKMTEADLLAVFF